jgi:hypothetical protein
LAPLE